MCEGDARLAALWRSARIQRDIKSHTEWTIRLHEVYRDEIAKQVDETCVAVQADETTDVSCKSQMVVVLPYILPCNTMTERFLEFVEVRAHSH